MEELFNRACNKFDQAETFHIQHWNQSVHFEANRVKQMDSRESSGVALRIVNGGKVGFAATTNLQKADSLIDDALEVLPFGPDGQFKFPSVQNFASVDVYDPTVESFPLEAMIDLGQKLIERVRSYNSEVLCDAVVTKSVGTVTIRNSSYGQATYTKSGFSVFVEGTLIKDTDMLFVGDGRSSCVPVTDTEEIAASVQRQLEWSTKIVPAPVGEVPVIFTPRGVAGVLLSPLMSGFSGKAVLQQSSPLTGKLGAQLLDKSINIWDDPTIPYAPGSRMCDDEGVPTRRLRLVENGVIGNFLYDLQTASQAGVESTGSAHRGLNTWPTPGANLIVVEPGNISFLDMIADIKDGLVVERLLGAGQSNILGGDFKANLLLGYRVQNGEVVGRVKDTLISGNVYSVLRDIQELENESHWVGGGLKTPAVYCGKISVATKG